MFHLVQFIAQVSAPNPPATAPPGLQEVTDRLISLLVWASAILAIISVIICGLVMIVGRRNKSAAASHAGTHFPYVLAGATAIALAVGFIYAVFG